MRFRYSFPVPVYVCVRVFVGVQLFVAFLCAASRRMQRKLSCCIVAAAVDAAAIVICVGQGWIEGYEEKLATRACNAHSLDWLALPPRPPLLFGFRLSAQLYALAEGAWHISGNSAAQKKSKK